MDAYRDWFSGYAIDPAAYLRRTFEEVGGYDELIVLRDISFESHCEHHMAPIIGRVHVGYLPANKVVGISKLARVVDGYARRFQVQEKLTAQIANCITEVLKPRGVGVVVSAVHECMTTRGVHKRNVSMVTSQHDGRVPQRRAHARRVPALHRHDREPRALARGALFRPRAARHGRRGAATGAAQHAPGTLTLLLGGAATPNRCGPLTGPHRRCGAGTLARAGCAWG